ncbi:MAG: acyltransferase [Actinomycetota bacterium]|nr:acyltransferase [Actinomycetota bacterium]
MTAREDFRRDIQGLRAIAVILVILNHAAIPGFVGGYIGVDVFFVISGFVITQLLLREATKGIRTGLADFYSRRIRRIVPAATATLVGTLIAAELVLGTRINPNLTGDVRWASLFAANFRLIATGSNYFVPGIHPSLVTQFWSLAVEEQFYLAFPLIVFVIARFMPPRFRLRALVATLGIAVILSAWWSLHISAGNPVLSYYSPFTRFWELGLGCLLAILTMRRPAPAGRIQEIAVVSGVVLLVIALLKLNSTSVYPGWLASLPCGAAAMLIWAGSAERSSLITRILSARPLVYLGALSYSLYLAHYVWLILPGQIVPPLTGWPWTLLEIGGTIISAALSYHLLENPIRRSRRLASDGIAIVLVLCVCVTASWTTAEIVAKLARVG